MRRSRRRCVLQKTEALASRTQPDSLERNDGAASDTFCRRPVAATVAVQRVCFVTTTKKPARVKHNTLGILTPTLDTALSTGLTSSPKVQIDGAILTVPMSAVFAPCGFDQRLVQADQWRSRRRFRCYCLRLLPRPVSKFDPARDSSKQGMRTHKCVKRIWP